MATIRNASAEQEKVLHATVIRGYVFRLVAENDEVWDCSEEVECEGGYIHTEEKRYGFHGGDIPPCGADYLCDEDGSYLVVSSESDPGEIDTVDGFRLEPVTLDDDWVSNDGLWLVKVIRVASDGETLLCGTTI